MQPPDPFCSVSQIPKRIIHIYSVPEGRPQELPLVCQAARANARLLHPDFELVLFDRDSMRSFVEREFPQYIDTLSRFALPIQRFDFFRYLAVYRLGGFYFDLDVFLAKKLDPLLGQQSVFAFEELTLSRHLRETGLDWELANFGFGARPGDPFLAAVIENCVRGQKDPAWAAQSIASIPSWFRGQFVAPTTTGPGLVSRTFAENVSLHNDITVLFPQDVCDESTWQRFGNFGVHLMQASWRKRDGFVRSRLARIWETRERAQLLATSRKLGPKRSGAWKPYGPSPSQ